MALMILTGFTWGIYPCLLPGFMCRQAWFFRDIPVFPGSFGLSIDDQA